MRGDCASVIRDVHAKDAGVQDRIGDLCCAATAVDYAPAIFSHILAESAVSDRQRPAVENASGIEPGVIDAKSTIADLQHCAVHVTVIIDASSDARALAIRFVAPDRTICKGQHSEIV